MKTLGKSLRNEDDQNICTKFPTFPKTGKKYELFVDPRTQQFDCPSSPFLRDRNSPRHFSLSGRYHARKVLGLVHVWAPRVSPAPPSGSNDEQHSQRRIFSTENYPSPLRGCTPKVPCSKPLRRAPVPALLRRRSPLASSHPHPPIPPSAASARAPWPR